MKMKFTFAHAVYAANNTHNVMINFDAKNPRFNAAFYVLRIGAINSHLVSDLMSTKRLSVDSRNLYGIRREIVDMLVLKLNDRTKPRVLTVHAARTPVNDETAIVILYLQFIVQSHCSRNH